MDMIAYRNGSVHFLPANMDGSILEENSLSPHSYHQLLQKIWRMLRSHNMCYDKNVNHIHVTGYRSNFRKNIQTPMIYLIDESYTRSN